MTRPVPSSPRRARLGRDASLLVAGQAVRAAGYGFTAVLLGALLGARGYSHPRAGVVLTSLIAGTALSSLVVGHWPIGSADGAATGRSSSASQAPAPRSGCCWPWR